MAMQLISFATKPTYRRFVDVTGQTFSRLTAIGYAGSIKPDGVQIRHLWWCKCICGTLIKARFDHLRTGNTESCGCMQKDAASVSRLTHGHCRGYTSTNEYKIWCSMISRCHNEKGSGYEYYGKRGISVCERWRLSFEYFLADMGPRPKGFQIERIDNNGNYCPENCRWETKTKQMQNTRRNHYVTFQGQTLCVTEWARIVGLSPSALSGRLNKGWTIADALTKPLNYRKRRTTL